MTAGPLPIFLIGGTALLALLIGLWQGRMLRRLGCEVCDLRQKLAELEGRQEHKPSFSNRLDQVEQARNNGELPRSRSEKYRYVASLATQGIDTKGIATALQMAPAEVEQLLQLSQLKQQVSGSSETTELWSES